MIVCLVIYYFLIVVLSQGQCILSLRKYMYVIFVFTLECYFVYNVKYTCLFSHCDLPPTHGGEYNH